MKYLTEQWQENRYYTIGGLLILVSTMAYCWSVGIYTELPSDVWRHLEHIQNQLEWPLSPDAQSRSAWYAVLAHVRYHSGISTAAFISTAGTLNTVLFILAVYGFVFQLLRDTLSQKESAQFAYIAALFFVLTAGISVFAFVRYYTFAPVFLSYILLLHWLLLLNRIMSGRQSLFSGAIPLILVFIALIVVHEQEALFAALYSAMVSFYYGWIYPRMNRVAGRHSRSRWNRYYFYLTVGLFIAVFVHGFLNLSPNSIGGKFEPWLLPLNEVMPFIDKLSIANPVFQVFQAVTLWGLLVYLGAVVNWRRIREFPLLWAGMLLPLFSLFNPFFVSLFVRHSYPNSLYRLIYAVPLFCVAALLLYYTWQDLKTKSWKISTWLSVLISVSLLLVWMPFESRYISQENSRVSTLYKIPQGNTHLYWADLLDWLRGQSRESIVSDPVTAYMIRALSRHQAPGWKFMYYPKRILQQESYEPDDFKPYAGWLLVMNHRSGSVSTNGQMSRHWPEHVLQTKLFYSEALTAFVLKHQQSFKRLWQKDGVSVYRIKRIW